MEQEISKLLENAIEDFESTVEPILSKLSESDAWDLEFFLVEFHRKLESASMESDE